MSEAKKVVEEGACGPPILEKIIRKLPTQADREECVARKYNCASVWCPICYRRFHLARHFARLSEMPWHESRLVTLTIDRQKMGEGADVYVWSREKKAIGRFIDKLQRRGVYIRDWAGQMEFHKDGTPHWHLLIRTKTGKAGMIGNQRLKQAWPWGGVREDFFKSRKHYDNTVGYFGKAGYFHKGKKYQTQLPDYFQSEYFAGKRIQRFYSARRKSDEQREAAAKKSEPLPSVTITGRKLNTCGQSVLLWYLEEDWAGFPKSDMVFLERMNVPYNEFVKTCPGEYVPGMGYTFWLSGTPPDNACPF